ncbi:hypothetical protein evm_014400 [Chilo suppressalis]|nr:hypothetical protein evm_014400 [Chilo suppressalis]
MKVEEKIELIKKKGLCFYCLRKGHSAKKCRVFVRCLICAKRHMTIMCRDIKEGTENKKTGNGKVSKENDAASNILLCHKDFVTLLPTVKVLVQNGSTMLRVRALIDSGAQRSYIKEGLARKLGLSSEETEMLGHYVFGGAEIKQKTHNVYSINVKDIEGSLCLQMEVLGTREICGPIPLVSNRKLLQKMSHHNIQLSDVINEEKEIEILIGADNSGILIGGEIIQLDDNVTAIRSKFGWYIQGPVSTRISVYNSLTCNLNVTDLWSLETLGIRDPAEMIKEKEQEDKIMKYFNDSITINNEGRYEVRLLWKEGYDGLFTNKTLAEKRLKSTTRRLIKTKNLDDYHDAFQNWLQSGIIERVQDDDPNNGHYLSHHAVIKEASATTRVRPVFNASAEDGRGNSLNRCLYAGVNMLEIILKKLTVFRMHAYGVTADISKAFLQISVTPEDRQYLKFLWWEDIKKQVTLSTYRHCRVVFGIACSPFLLNATIAYHLERQPKELQETARKLKNSYYVDNCVLSFESKKEVSKFMKESKQLMDAAKMDLRGWTGNYMKEHAKMISILGLMWDIDDDTLACNVGYDVKENEIITKRVLLSYAQKTFDPIGFTSPVTLIPKLLMQGVWSANIGWDERIPEDIEKDFTTWRKNMNLLRTCKVPRRMSSIPFSNDSCVQIHTFCDASKKSYGACVFIRVECGEDVSVQLLAGKSRVAPSNKDICIPRLELIAATISTRLYRQATDGLDIKFKSYFWTDSSVVLAWITTLTIWKPFVQNRVNEIRRNTNRDDWCHLPGVNNPADLLSRGCYIEKLVESRWWEGPNWLKFSIKDWPKSEIILDHNAVEAERRQTVICVVDQVEGDIISKLLKFSSYSKMVRIIAWIQRFCNNCRKGNKNLGKIKSEEFLEAQDKLFYLIQTEHFRNVNRTLPKLKMVTDKKGLIRVVTKLLLSEDENDHFKQPILLPGNSVVIERLVREKHLVMQHAGLHILLAELRNFFWVTRAKKLIRQVVGNCIRCKRYSAKAYETPLASLPYDRVGLAVAFEITGIDLAGPLFLANGEKCYIVLFTCAVYRALHLELVESLSTEAFISALRRFIARRGRVKIIYSDNGSNFTGAHNLLENIDWNDIVLNPHCNQIKWHFSPPAAPWWGGFWERMVQMVKALLLRVLGNAKLNYVELLTVLCDIEAAINARPLTYVSESEDLVPLTPNHFIHPLPSNDVLDLDIVDDKKMKIKNCVKVLSSTMSAALSYTAKFCKYIL